MTSADSTRPTVSMAVRAGAQVLAAAGIDAPAVEARLLMSYALADSPAKGHPRVPLDSSALFMRGDEPAPAVFERWLRSRAERIPLQHIAGSAPFCGVDLLSGPEGFIPRPETELLVDWADHWLRTYWTERTTFELSRRLFSGHLTVVDVCSGPGTIALGLAHRLGTMASTTGADIEIIGLEIDPQAIELARANEKQLRDRGLLASNIDVRFHRADVRDPSLVGRLGLVNSAQLVLSNPPYVPETAIDQGLISPEVMADPRTAVFAGSDGMELMDPLVRTMELLSAPVAALAIEHDDATGPLVRSILEEHKMLSVEQHRDLAERDRFVTARVQRDPGDIPRTRVWS